MMSEEISECDSSLVGLDRRFGSFAPGIAAMKHINNHSIYAKGRQPRAELYQRSSTSLDALCTARAFGDRETSTAVLLDSERGCNSFRAGKDSQAKLWRLAIGPDSCSHHRGS